MLCGLYRMVVNTVVIGMKNLYALFVLFIIVSFTSCGGNKQQSNDTIFSDSVASEDVDEQIVFESPDLRWRDLSGHVERCVTMRFSAFKRDSVYIAKSLEPESYDTICFNNKGQVERIVMWVNWSDEDLLVQNTTLHYDENDEFIKGEDRISRDEVFDVNIIRDEEGYITKLLRLRPDDGVVAFGDEVEWDGDRISEYTFIEYDMSSTWQRRYDQEGRLTEEQTLYVGVEEGGENNLRYGYLAIDSLGNWIERYVINEYVNIHYNIESGQETRMTQPQTYYIERRKIDYYDN